MNNNKGEIDLVNAISKKLNYETPIIEAFLNQFFLEINSSILNNNLPTNVEGLGTFYLKEIDNNKTISFKGTKVLKEKRNLNDLNTLKEKLNTDKLKGNKDAKIEPIISPTHIRNDKYLNNAQNNSNLKKITKKDTHSLISSNVHTRLNQNKDLIAVNESSFKEGATTNSNFFDKNSGIEDQKKSGISTTNLREEEQFTTTSKNKLFRRESVNKVLVAIICLLSMAIIAILLFLLGKNSNSNTRSQDMTAKNAIFSSTTNNTNGSNKYKELIVYETSKYSFIIIPETDTSLEDISEYYYGNKVFWPYIYYANNDYVDKKLLVMAGSIVKIPKLTIDLAEYNRGNIQRDTQKLGDKIKNILSNK